MTIAFWLVWGGLFGVCLGSFLNVVILRDDKRSSIVTGRSYCPNCKHTLAWYDLVPVLSFITLAGRCRYCRKPISFQYPLIELLGGVLVAGCLWYGWWERGSVILTTCLSFSVLLFLAVSVLDMRTYQVPIEYVVAAGLVGAFGMVVSGQRTLGQAGLGIVVGAGSLALILYGWKLLFKQDGMGEGDLWIAGAIGAITGYPLIIVALISAVFSGALFGSVLLLFNKKKLASAVPFGPFLFLGLLFALIWGQGVVDWYILSL